MKRTKTIKNRPSTAKILLLTAVPIVLLNGAVFFAWVHRSNGTIQTELIPHYFETAAMAAPLPHTLDPSRFSNRDVKAAYQSAKEIPEVLAQQPCYCHCDRHMGHRSLLDCFASVHASDCDICVKEALFALQEHRKGRSAEQIRSEVVRGDWKTIRFQD